MPESPDRPEPAPTLDKLAARPEPAPTLDQPSSRPEPAPTLDKPAGRPEPAPTLDKPAGRHEPAPRLDKPSLSSVPPADMLADTFPQSIGGFVIRDRIGEGEFGVVYRAYNEQLDRDIALKVAKPHRLDSAERVERFLREARTAANLRHPHIVPLHETGRDGKHYYIASSFIHGTTLYDAIESHPGPWEPHRAARLVRSLASALAYAHEQGIIHRDVKPANVLLDATEQPHLADFGLAKRLGGEEGQTQDGSILGTPQYMAPEQAAGKGGEAGPAADQYALGVILYELLTGRTPFGGPPEMQIYHHVHTEPPRLRSVNPALPRDLETICLTCLEKEPGRRYTDCTALAEDLRRWQAGEPVTVRRPGVGERLVRWTRKNPAVAGLAWRWRRCC